MKNLAIILGCALFASHCTGNGDQGSNRSAGAVSKTTAETPQPSAIKSIETVVTNVPYSPEVDIVKQENETVLWTQTSGPTDLEISDPTSTTPVIRAPVPGNYGGTITIINEWGAPIDTRNFEFEKTDALLPMTIGNSGWDDPNPRLKLYQPFPNYTFQVFAESTCSSTPLAELDTRTIEQAQDGEPFTVIPVQLAAPGQYTLYGKYKGGTECMTEGVPYEFHRTFLGSPTITQVFRNKHAFAALYSNGMVITWGNASNGGNSSAVAARLNGNNPVVDIASTSTAFAAIHADGSVTTWGDPAAGGVQVAFDEQGTEVYNVTAALNGTNPVTNITGTWTAFAAIHADGSVTAWGNQDQGGTTPVIAKATQSISSTAMAFAARHGDGTVTCWGDIDYGGSCSDQSGISNIFGGAGAFAAIKNDGSVSVWGAAVYGGSIAGVSGLDGSVAVTEIVGNDSGAFAALRVDGSVITWGVASVGGNGTANVPALNGSASPVAKITASSGAFAALHEDGSVTAWGENASGNHITPSVASSLAVSASRWTTQIVATNTAFTALHNDGTVTSWGYNLPRYSNDPISDPPEGTGNVSALYATSGAFAARKSDGTVTTWGSVGHGGSTESIAAALNGANPIVNMAATMSAFAAVHADGSLTAWGGGAASDTSAVASRLDGTNDAIDVKKVFATKYAFAAIHDDGTVTTWGDSNYGGDASAVAAALDGSAANFSPVVNIVGTPLIPLANEAAFAALHENGAVTTWGSSNVGGNSASVGSAMDGSNPVVRITANRSAFAAVHQDGSVTAWGTSADGGDTSGLTTPLSGVKEIAATGRAFAALHADGSITTWGAEGYGHESSGITIDVANNPAIAVSGSDRTFAAVLQDGTVKAWTGGGQTCAFGCYIRTVTGGLFGVPPSGASNVQSIKRQYSTFTALHRDGSVTWWGNSEQLNMSEAQSAAMNGTNPVQSITAAAQPTLMTSYFASLHEDDSVTMWGAELGGVTTTDVAAYLSGDHPILNIYATSGAFAALHADGSVTTWGEAAQGAQPFGPIQVNP